VLALAGGQANIVDVLTDPPVGVSIGRPRRSTTITVPEGALLCFYTDGLVERRAVPLDVGLKDLCAAVVAGPVESVCTRIMGRLLGDDPPADDIAVLVLRRQPLEEIETLDLTPPAQLLEAGPR
jgi:serine phosphatase RsbU (regulator of sigma subunit)